MLGTSSTPETDLYERHKTTSLNLMLKWDGIVLVLRRR